jgi:hypothetical protein
VRAHSFLQHATHGTQLQSTTTPSSLHGISREGPQWSLPHPNHHPHGLVGPPLTRQIRPSPPSHLSTYRLSYFESLCASRTQKIHLWYDRTHDGYQWHVRYPANSNTYHTQRDGGSNPSISTLERDPGTSRQPFAASATSNLPGEPDRAISRASGFGAGPTFTTTFLPLYFDASLTPRSCPRSTPQPRRAPRHEVVFHSS